MQNRTQWILLPQNKLQSNLYSHFRDWANWPGSSWPLNRGFLNFSMHSCNRWTSWAIDYVMHILLLPATVICIIHGRNHRVIFAWPWKNQNQRWYTNQSARWSKQGNAIFCTYLSLLVSTIQWNLKFSETDQSDQCDGVSLAVSAGLLFSALNYWMSLLFTLLLLWIKKIKWRRRRCCVWLRRLTKFRERKAAFIIPARRVCIESIQAHEIVICSCISVPNSPHDDIGM